MHITYYQGETIGFYIEGDAIINLESNDFKVEFYNNSAKTNKIVIPKSKFTLISSNKYYAEIANAVTKTLQRGTYTCEQMYGDNYTSIAQEEAFILVETEIKREL